MTVRFSYLLLLSHKTEWMTEEDLVWLYWEEN